MVLFFKFNLTIFNARHNVMNSTHGVLFD